MRPWIGPAAVGFVALATAALAVADDSPMSQEPVLHEYVAPPSGGSGGTQARILDPLAGDPKSVGGPDDHHNPVALRSGDKLLPEPPKSPTKSPDEPMLGRPGFAADRETEARPDRATNPDGTLHYVE